MRNSLVMSDLDRGLLEGGNPPQPTPAGNPYDIIKGAFPLHRGIRPSNVVQLNKIFNSDARTQMSWNEPKWAQMS